MKKRIRKKKHLGEFQEIGFELEFTFDIGSTIDEENKVLYAFIDHAIEDNNLFFGGGGEGGLWSGVAYANGPPGTRTTPEQRAAVLTRLEDHPRVITAKASDFFDLWYDELPSERGLNRGAHA